MAFTAALALLLMLGCGGRGGSIGTAPTATGLALDPAPRASTAEALARLRATPVCIAPDVCEDFSQWHPRTVFRLGDSVVLADDEHAFVWIDERWVHHSLPGAAWRRPNAPPTVFSPAVDGHRALFCGESEGRIGVFELTTSGLVRRSLLPRTLHTCRGVAGAGAQLFVLTDAPGLTYLSGPQGVWEQILPELRVRALRMTPSRAVALDEACRVLELSAESSHAKVIVDPEDSSNCHLYDTSAGVERQSLALITGRALMFIDLSNEVAQAADAASSSGVQTLVLPEPSDELPSDLSLGLVGLNPPIYHHLRLLEQESERSAEVRRYVNEYLLWNGSALVPVEDDDPEISTFNINCLSGACGSLWDGPRWAPSINDGPYRISVRLPPLQGNTNDAAPRPSVMVWRRDGVRPVASGLPIREGATPPGNSVDVELLARCRDADHPRARCAPMSSGSLARFERSGLLEILDPDDQVLAHAQVSHLGWVSAGTNRVYFLQEGRPHYLDLEGTHPVEGLPPGEAMRTIVVAEDDDVYFLTASGGYHFDGQALQPFSHPLLAQLLGSLRPWLAVDNALYALLPSLGIVRVQAGVPELIVFPEEVPSALLPMPPNRLLAIGPNGRSWILHGPLLLEVDAPPLGQLRPAAHFLIAGPQGWYLRVDEGGEIRRYRVPRPSPRELGPISAFARPLSAMPPLARPLWQLQGPSRTEGLLTHEALEGFLQYCAPETGEPGAQRGDRRHCQQRYPAFRSGAAAIFADVTMETVLFTSNAHRTSATPWSNGEVGPTETSPQGAGAVDFLAPRLRGRGLSQLPVLELAPGRASSAGDDRALMAVVSSANREQLLRVRVERDSELVIELHDGRRSQVSILRREALPQRGCPPEASRGRCDGANLNRLHGGQVAFSASGRRLAIRLEMSSTMDSGEAREPIHRVLSLPVP